MIYKYIISNSIIKSQNHLLQLTSIFPLLSFNFYERGGFLNSSLLAAPRNRSRECAYRCIVGDSVGDDNGSGGDGSALL